MNLLFPLGLAAFAAAIVPLLIHLARRTEQRPTDFAALRWLRQKPRPRHRPRFDELLLLAVRLLLIGLLALLLARPVLPDAGDRRAVIAVAPGVDPAALAGFTSARRLWLAPGFPALDTPAPGAVPIASLIRQLDADLPAGTPLTVIVPRVLTGADAERPRLSRAVTWRIVPGTMPATPVEIRPLRVALRLASEPGAGHIRAAIAALGVPADTASPDRPIPANISALVRLAPGTLPADTMRWIAAGGTALVARETLVPAMRAAPSWQGADGTTLVETPTYGMGRILRFTRTLTPAAMPGLVEPDFPRRLFDLLSPQRLPPDRVAADAYRPLTGELPPAPPTRDLLPWLVVGIAALWLVERWLATSLRRTRAR